MTSRKAEFDIDAILVQVWIACQAQITKIHLSQKLWDFFPEIHDGYKQKDPATARFGFWPVIPVVLDTQLADHEFRFDCKIILAEST